MVLPLEPPLTPVMGNIPPPSAQIQDLINNANQQNTAVTAAVQQALQQQIQQAASGVAASKIVIGQQIAAHLNAAQQASSQVQNGLDTHILGQLGSAAAMGSQIPGFQPPTIQNLAAAATIPAPPPPPPIPAAISSYDQVFSPGGPGQQENVGPITSTENCQKIKWKLPNGTYGIFAWRPGIDQPPQAPSSWEVYDGPKPCSANWIPELPPTTPPAPPPLPIKPPSLIPISLPPPDNLPVTVESNNGPCPSGVTGPAPVYAKTHTYQGVTVPVARFGVSIWIGYCLPGYFAPYKNGSDQIVPVWGKDSQKMYACIMTGDPTYTLQNYVIIDYPEGNGSRAYSVQFSLKLGEVYAIDYVDDGGPGLDPGQPGSGSGPTYPPISGTPTQPVYPPVSGTPPTYPPVSGNPIINNPVGGPAGPGSPSPPSPTPPPSGGSPSPSPTPGGPTPPSPTPAPISPYPPTPVSPAPPGGPTPPTPYPPSPTPPTPYPPPPTYPTPPTPPPPSPYPPTPYPPQPTPPTPTPPTPPTYPPPGSTCPPPVINVSCPPPYPTSPTPVSPTPGGPPTGLVPTPGGPTPTPTPGQFDTPPETGLPSFQFPNFCDLDWNKTIDNITAKLQGGQDFDLLKAIGLRGQDGTYDRGSWFAQILNSVPTPTANGIIYLCDQFSKIINGQIKLGGVPAIAFLAPGILKSLASLITHFTGISLGGIEQKVEYWQNYLAPRMMPGASEFNTMRLAGVVTAEQWYAGVRANAECDRWQSLILDADRQRPSIEQMLKAEKLGLLSGPFDYSQFQTYGFRNEGEAGTIKALDRSFPFWEETLDWWKKSVFSDAHAAAFGLDDGLDDVQSSPAAIYAKAAGTDAELLKYRWRAHWQLPPAQFALDALHRLRPGRVPADIAVTNDTAKLLLEANGIPSGYVDRYIALSQPIVTRREMYTLYSRGALSKDEVKQRLADLGYAADIAAAMADAFQIQKVEQLSTLKESQFYVKGALSQNDLAVQLRKFGAEADDVTKVVDRLDQEVIANSRVKIIDSVHARFLSGNIQASQLTGALVNLGVDPINVTAMAEQWNNELIAKEKHIEAGQLVSWYTQGLLAQPELVTRLARLNYQAGDITGIVAMADAKIAELVSKQVMAKKKADDKAKQQIAKQAAAEGKATAAASRAAEKLANAVNKVTIELQVHDKISTDDAHKMVMDAISKYRQLPNSSDAGATDFIKNAWEIHSKKGGPDWAAVVDDYVASLKEKQNAQAN